MNCFRLMLLSVCVLACGGMGAADDAERFRNLFELAARGSADEVSAAISQKANILIRSTNGGSALMFAAKYNPDPGVIKVLIKAGLDVNEQDLDLDTPLTYAARNNAHSEVIAALLDAGAKINARNKAGFTPLMLAAEGNSNPDVLTLLISRKAKVNDQANNGATALIQAARFSRNADAVIQLLRAKSDVEEHDNSGRTALMHAAEASTDPKVIEALVTGGAKINRTDGNGWTPLMLAAASNHNPEIIKALVAAKADVNRTTPTGMTALMYAAMLGTDSKIPAAILDAGADPLLRDKQGKTAADYAVNNPGLQDPALIRRLSVGGTTGIQPADAKIDLFRLVKDSPPDLIRRALRGTKNIAEIIDENGRNLLMTAAANNPDPGVVAVLLKIGIDINAKDRSGWTALMHAASLSDNSRMIDTLCANKADITVTDLYGKTALMLAARTNETPEIFASLAKAGANFNASDRDGITAMMIAARSNSNPLIIEQLSRLGARVNEQDRAGRTPLMYAANSATNPEVIKTLLKLGAIRTTIDKAGQTVAWYAQNNPRLERTSSLYRELVGDFNAEATQSLWEVVATGTPEQVETLLLKGANQNERNREKDTPLIVAAAKNPDPRVILALINAGAAIDEVNAAGETALMAAAARTTNPEVVKTLMDKGAELLLPNPHGLMAADIAMANRAMVGTEVLKQLKKLSTISGDEKIADPGNLFEVAAKGTPDQMAKLLDKGGDVNCRDANERTPLMWAAKWNSRPEMLELLIRKGANRWLEDKDGKMAFYYANLNNKVKGTPVYWELLPRKKGEYDFVGKQLFNLAANGRPEQIEKALESIKNVNIQDDSGATPLMWAAWKNTNAEIAALLLRAGADPNIRNKEGSTALMFAAALNQNPQVLETLLDAGADPTIRDKSGKTGKTAFDWAQGNKILKAHPVYARLTTQDKTLFDLVVDGTPEQIRAAIKRGDNPNGRDDFGGSPLMRAAANNLDPAVIEILISAGAKVNAVRGRDGLTPLIFAATFNPNPDVIELLIRAGAEINAKDKDGMSPVMWAVLKNLNPDVVAALIKAKADLTLKNKYGKTVLTLAEQNLPFKTSATYWELVKAVKGPGAVVAPTVATTTTATIDLLALADGGTPEQIKAALEVSGAQVGLRDPKGNTPLLRAARNNPNPEIIRLLLQGGADGNAANAKGETALMLAATYTTNPETVLALLDAKVDDSRKDNEGRTALILADQNEKMRGTPAYRKLVEMATQRSLRDLMKAH